jgi:hypothetical protein
MVSAAVITEVQALNSRLAQRSKNARQTAPKDFCLVKYRLR